MIAFVGSVFSPYYAWRGRKDPEDHVAINVALYAPHAHRWTMTERGRRALDRSEKHFQVGPSSLEWQGGKLVIDFDEIAVPRPPHQLLPRRMAGRITLTPHAITGRAFDIDTQGNQRWWPTAPSADIHLTFTKGDMPDWHGHGYQDSNWGLKPLEASFRRWDWARGALADGESVILYDADLFSDEQVFLVLRFDKDGNIIEQEALPYTKLERGFWGVGRGAHADPGETPVIAKTLEDGPFYMRSVIDTKLFGQDVRLMHESLSGTRFANPIVKAMLPFRMPRRAHYSR